MSRAHSSDDRLSHESEVTVLTTETEIVDALSDGEKGTIFVQETPFYATSGGQGLTQDTSALQRASSAWRIR